MIWEATKTTVDLAFSVARQSPDPYMKVGAVGLDVNEIVVATGWNRTNPFAYEGHKFWKDREGRRPKMIHAEQTLVSNLRAANIRTKNESRPMVYVMINLLPCVHCMNLLAAFEVQVVCYVMAYDKDAAAFDVAKWHGIELKQVDDFGNKFISL